MSLTATDKGGGDFVPAPTGTHLCVCIGVIDLGIQPPNPNSKFQGISQPKVLLKWELPDERMELREDEQEGRPFIVTRIFTVSTSEKSNLRPFLEHWRGRKFSPAEIKEFRLEKLIGKKGQIAISHSEDGKYANVDSVVPLIKGLVCPDAENPLVVFNLDHFDQQVFDSFSEKLQAMIMNSSEMRNKHGEQPSQDAFSEPIAESQGTDDYDDDDGIPF